MTAKSSTSSMPVIAAAYLGPSLVPNMDAAWEEAQLPLNPDDLVQHIMGQPLRRAGRFIKLVCCGALTCLQSVPKEILQGKKVGIFLSTGLGNMDEILPFITQVFKYEGGFPSPNQFANSVSNAAAFFLARASDIKGVVLTISQEELSFESALWLAQSYLDADEIDMALVGGCDVFTPTTDDCRERMNLRSGDYRAAPMGEGSSWLLLGGHVENPIGDILSVTMENPPMESGVIPSGELLQRCNRLFDEWLPRLEDQETSRLLLPGFRLVGIDAPAWESRGWVIDDYLPHCGISSTASAYGLARALLSRKPAFLVHCNYHASGRLGLVAAITKKI